MSWQFKTPNGYRGNHGHRGNNLFSREDGVAVLVVIMVMLVASFLVSQLALQVRTELKITDNIKRRTASFFLSEAGISLAVFRLFDMPKDIDPDDELAQFHEGYQYETMLPNGRVRYYAVNESGKIDLNTFPQQLMELFLEYQGLDPDAIATVIDSTLDWRDPDDLHRMNGAESEVYQALPDPYIARNGKILDPAEFFLINGTEALAGKFDPAEIFTVYNSRGRINFNSLTPAMLDFLVAGDQEKKEAYRLAQEELEGKRALTSSDAMEILDGERFNEVKQFLTYSSSRNQYYFIEAIGEAGYERPEEAGTVIVGSEEETGAGNQKRHLPGIRLVVLIEWQRTRFKYLSWKETYI